MKTTAEIAEMRHLHDFGLSLRLIGDIFDISGTRVGQLLNQKTAGTSRRCVRCDRKMQNRRKPDFCSVCENAAKAALPRAIDRRELKAQGLKRCPDCKGTRPIDSKSYCSDCMYRRENYKGWLKRHANDI